MSHARRVRSIAALAPLLLVASCGAMDDPLCLSDACTGGDPTAAAAPDPGQPGPLRTARFDLRVPLPSGALQTTVTGPSSDGKTLAAGPYPLVVFSPGFTVSRNLYDQLAARLASHGILTVSQTARSESNHAQYRDDTRRLIDWLIAPTGASAAQLAGRVDAAHIGVSGHSLGGKIAVMVAVTDPRIGALLPIDPVDGGNGGNIASALGQLKLRGGAPVGLLGETISGSGGFMPCAPTARNYQTFFSAAAAPAFAIQFLKAAHMDFVDSTAGCLACSFCPGGTAPKARTHDLTLKYVTAYFLWTLRGISAATDALSGMSFQADVAAGDVRRSAK